MVTVRAVENRPPASPRKSKKLPLKLSRTGLPAWNRDLETSGHSRGEVVRPRHNMTRHAQNVGMATRSPPFMADSWAQRPTMVQLAEVCGVGQGGAVAADGAQEGVDQVRVRAAVAAALKERQVLGVLDGGRLGEPADAFGEQVGVVGHLDPLGDLGLGERVLGRALGVDDRILALDLLPLERLLAAGGVEALAVLPGRVEEAAGHLGDDVGVLDLERRRLDGERDCRTAR